MKKLNMNIKLEDIPTDMKRGREKGEIKNDIEIFIIQCDNALQLAHPRANIQALRSYDKILNKMEKHENGIAILEDEDFRILQSSFDKADFPNAKELRKILIRVKKQLETAVDIEIVDGKVIEKGKKKNE